MEFASGGAALASLRTSPTQGGLADAGVGVNWKLNLNGADWKKVQNMPIKVTMYFSYHIASKGNAASSLGAGEGVYQWNIATLNNESLSGTKALTHTGFVFEVFRYWGAYPAITGGASVGLSSQTAAAPGVETGAGQASGSVFIYAIVLEFPQTAG